MNGRSETAPQPPVADEAEQARRLRRFKRLATGSLAAAVALLVIARALEARHPAWGYIAAFAEAAAIGGLADWYAVVALFRRPLGLPIPHTAIIPDNQQRIGDNLGRFIERQFLAPGPVAAKLREVDFTRLASDWLSDTGRSAGLAGFVTRLLPRALGTMEQSALRTVINQKLRAQIDAIDIAPVASRILQALTDENRHQLLLDHSLDAFHALLQDDATIDSIRDRIRDELPAMFRAFRAEHYVLRKLLQSAHAFISDVRARPDHPMRAEFDIFVRRFIQDLQTSPAHAERLLKWKTDLIDRPEWLSLGQTLWQGMKDYVAADIAAPDSVIGRNIQAFLVDLGRQLAADPQLRQDMNDGLVTALASLIESHKSNVAVFIADQVKAWDMTQLVRLIELNIGRDLQYIRFNGMIIGGLAGLVLHTLKKAFALG